MQWALAYLSLEHRLCGEVDGSDRKTCLTTRKHPRGRRLKRRSTSTRCLHEL